MAVLKVVGQHKGSVTLSLDTATVLDLKNAVSTASGLPAAGLKLLAGGKHLKDDASKLAQCGITPGKTIMVLRQDYSEKVDAEASLNRRTEEAVQAASRLSARAARDIGNGGRGNAWGRWGRGNSDGGGGGGGASGRSGGRGGRGGRGFDDERPEIELTNQDGEAMAIPREDSAALMEGMMLHRQGLACMAKMRARPTTEASMATGGGAAAGAAAAAAASAPDGVQTKKARRRPLSPLTSRQRQQQGVAAGCSTSSTVAPCPTTIAKDAGNSDGSRTEGGERGKKECGGGGGGKGSGSEGDGKKEAAAENVNHEGRRTGSTPKPENPRGGGRPGGDGEQVEGHPSGGWEERKESESSSAAVPRRGEGRQEEEEGGYEGKGPLLREEAGNEVDGMDVDSDAAASAVATAAASAARRPALSAAEKLMAQREALGLLMRAEDAFRRCDPKYLEAVDNYVYLCLDIVWLLFLMKDMKNLDLATRMLAAVEKGFQKAHGPGLQRLTALKGEHCAEKLLYVRLHLLQGVVAFLQGESGKASALLIRASAEAKSLKPNPALASRLMQQWYAVKFEVLRPKVALRALRAGRNNLDAAWQYLESLHQRKETVRKERRRRREQRRANRRHGLTADKKAFVDGALVDQLAEGGFPRPKAVSALRRHNNDVGAALASLTAASGPGGARGGPGGSGGGGGGGGSSASSGDEALAVLQSLGVPPEAAREVLSRTGTLCDALRELGLGEEAGGGGGSSGSTGGGGGGVAGAAPGDGEGGQDDGGGSEEGGDEGGDGDDDLDSEPTPEEKRLFEELAADRENQDDEGYLDVTLEDEADAADMYLLLCRGNVPIAFDLDKIRASVAAAAAAATAAAAVTTTTENADQDGV